MSYHQDARPSDIWTAIKTRLDSADMRTILGAANRVYTNDEPIADLPQLAGQGRLIITAATTAFTIASLNGPTDPVNFLVVVEYSGIRKSGYRVGVSLDAAHAEAYALLDGWLPDVVSFRHAMIAMPVYRYSRPQSMPLWDATQGLFYKSAEYRTEIAPGALLAPVATVDVQPDVLTITYP